MKKKVKSLRLGVMSGAMLIVVILSMSPGSVYAQIFKEDFSNPQLDPAWQVVQTFPWLGGYSLTDNPGYLRYYLTGSLGYNGGWTPTSGSGWPWYWKPSLTLLRQFDGGNWILKTKVGYNLCAHIGGTSQWNSTGGQYQYFYIAFGEGANEYIQIYRGVDWWYGFNSLAMGLVRNGVEVARFDGTPSPIGDDGWARENYWYEITRNGEEITVRFSNDDINYTTAFSASLTEPVTTTQRAIIDMALYNAAGSYVDWDYIYVEPGIMENQPPVALCRDIIVPAGEQGQAEVTPGAIDDGSYDPDGDPLAYAISPAGPYPLGDTLVTLTVTDTHGAEASCSAKITVYDDTPPSITSLAADPNSLWPANHKMVPVFLVISAIDNCSPTVISQIIDVRSNEPVDGLGDGDTAPDWLITGPLTLNLRAERSGNGAGRIYTITIECRDAAGNKATGIVTVKVPKSQGK